ncbi:MAG: hypothetical protein JRI25_11640 [Deltaproteobacteria bacterium]|nr:hypothetical protein [Deltaproteobacteria bacterium]MBW2255238.1 hypothetical protein [Deltaproteobacteria bacterium]
MWLLLPLTTLALAENIGTESLEWRLLDSDIAVRARVARTTDHPIEGDAWREEEVTVEVLESLTLQDLPKTLTFTWRTRPEEALGDRQDHQVLLFLTRGPDGVLAPRSSLHSYVDLAHPNAWTASTAHCEVLDSGQAVLAYLRPKAADHRPAIFPSHWTTWTWQQPGSTWADCPAHTETYTALWAGSAVGVMVPQGLSPFEPVVGGVETTLLSPSGDWAARLVRAATGSEAFPEYQVEIGDRNTGEKSRVGGAFAGWFGLRATWDAKDTLWIWSGDIGIRSMRRQGDQWGEEVWRAEALPTTDGQAPTVFDAQTNERVPVTSEAPPDWLVP